MKTFKTFLFFVIALSYTNLTVLQAQQITDNNFAEAI